MVDRVRAELAIDDCQEYRQSAFGFRIAWSPGQITNALFEVGGQYRRSM